MEQSSTKVPKSNVVIRDFLGLVSNGDPVDIPPGAATRQVNWSCLRPSRLSVRPGFRIVVFEDN